MIVGMMPALWRGHHRQLRASEDRWEWAAGVESSTESARLLSEDKYDLDYQLDEEEGENFNQWQAQLEDTQQPAHAPDGEKGGSPAEITASVPVRNSTLALTLDDPAPGVSAALEALATLAWHSYGIALHYTGEDDPNGAEATMEAMRHAVQAVAPGFTAATLVRLANDPQLGLTTEQRLYIDELAIALDLETLEALHGADPGTSSEEEK
ncbi:hypothetical protein [Streptomyces californicus]|uniref:hypothetical protein n=1 Tax=Streptomyces californicus TaxID=67351 RepID=UPI0037AC0C46